MNLADMLSEITPKYLHRIEITPTFQHHAAGVALWLGAERCFIIQTPHPLESWSNFLIFMHECAHIALGHTNPGIKGLPAHPYHGTYSNEIMAWALVNRWLKQYGVEVPDRKFMIRSGLKRAWEERGENDRY